MCDGEFFASMSWNMLMAHTVCNATIIGVRYKVSSLIFYFVLSNAFSVYIPTAWTLIYVNDAKHILSLCTQRTIHFSR
jgi:hypothetical protein